MTFFGWIFFIFLTASLLHLMGEGIKSAMRIDKWSDLWGKTPKPEEPETKRTEFKGTVYNINIKITCEKPEPDDEKK